MGTRQAFGHPGSEPRWSRGAKDGIGTAYSSASRIWFTLWNGIVTEVYYPTVDRPQLRDLQYLVTDGAGMFHEEKRDLSPVVERLAADVLGYRVTSRPADGAYTLTKEVITDPELPCVLLHTTLTAGADLLGRLRLHVLCAPHLEVGGWGNNAAVFGVAGSRLLMAEKRGTWLALGATAPFVQASCGYVGASDGWADLAAHGRMAWSFETAPDGNVALTGLLDPASATEHTLGLAFGESHHHAAANLLQALRLPFAERRDAYVRQWRGVGDGRRPMRASGDGEQLYHGSVNVLLAHEDKAYPGALIASMSIPWGEAAGDDDQGGYHVVWVRDMISSAGALHAAGNTETPLRALLYLMVSQQPDGGFPQNFWINGEPYWRGIQLDEVSFPILLARRLHRDGALGQVDPWPLVVTAAGYLVRNGPATGQERWEEAGGYSPSTLAANIAALVCAACFARERGEDTVAQVLEEHADFLERHLEGWTVTRSGSLVAGIPRHYIRLLPATPGDPGAGEDPDAATLAIANRPPGSPWSFPAKDIVDAGFLELVRYGVRRADDPLIADSVAVVDAVLKVQTPFGPCWHRYNHDGYGQRDDGGPFTGWGTGRAWPLLTGERGHYELAAGRDPGPYLRALEALATAGGMLTEQVWDAPDRPDQFLLLGRPTGSATPLCWAHAEYVKLLRSASDGAVFDLVPEVAERYRSGASSRPVVEPWSFSRPVRAVPAGATLRVRADAPFRLRWSLDEWRTTSDTDSTGLLGAEHADIRTAPAQRSPIRFTFWWTQAGRWEGRDFEVSVGA